MTDAELKMYKKKCSEMLKDMERINAILKEQKTGFQMKASMEEDGVKFIAYEIPLEGQPYRIASDVTPMRTLKKLALNTGYIYNGVEHDPVIEALRRDQAEQAKQNKRG